MTTITLIPTASQTGNYREVAPFCFGGLIPVAFVEPTNTVDFAISLSPALLPPVTRTLEYAVEHYDGLLRKLAD